MPRSCSRRRGRRRRPAGGDNARVSRPALRRAHRAQRGTGRSGAEGQELVLRASGLPGGELGVARVVRVIHVVVDRIEARVWGGVLALGATPRRGALGGGIGGQVAPGCTTGPV